VAGYGTTYVFTTIEPGNPIFFTALVPWITAWITLTLATNVVCTCPPIHPMALSSPLTLLVSGLIAYRIVSTARAVRGLRIGRDRLMSTLIVIVESASIYSSTLVALIASYLSGNNGQFVVLDVVRGIPATIAGYILIWILLADHFSHSRFPFIVRSLAHPIL
jgi:hypothetical protein